MRVVCCVILHYFIDISLAKMDKLPKEIIMQIFSFLPLPFVFRSVSLVSKQFHCIAYDHNLVKFAIDMIQEVDTSKGDSLCPKALWK